MGISLLFSDRKEISIQPFFLLPFKLRGMDTLSGKVTVRLFFVSFLKKVCFLKGKNLLL